jgi:hypothetical protein
MTMGGVLAGWLHRRQVLGGWAVSDEVARIMMRLVTVGVGPMNSPRYAPAGLLVTHRGMRVMIDGGPGAEPGGRLDAWLLTDARAELGAGIRALARVRGLTAHVGEFDSPPLRIELRPVVHTSHPTVGYEIVAAGRRAVWAPEFWEFPSWAQKADLMFAEAAGWNRPIRFAGGVGGRPAAGGRGGEAAGGCGVWCSRTSAAHHQGAGPWQAASVRRNGARRSGLPPDQPLKQRR